MKKTGKLAGLFSNLVRTKGDDALRLASNYGDNVSDLTRALAPGGASTRGVINPYLGIPEQNLSDLYIRDAIDTFDNNAAAFRQSMNDRFQANMDALQNRFNSLNDAVDAWGANLRTPKSNIALEMGDPPPLVDRFTPSAADDDWFTQDLLNRGVLDDGSHYGDDISKLIADFDDDYLALPFVTDSDTMSKIIDSKRVPHDRLSEMYATLRDNLRRVEQDYRYTSGASGLSEYDDWYEMLNVLSPFKPVEKFPF